MRRVCNQCFGAVLSEEGAFQRYSWRTPEGRAGDLTLRNGESDETICPQSGSRFKPLHSCYAIDFSGDLRIWPAKATVGRMSAKLESPSTFMVSS